ncbi:hypothetical protein FRC12_005247 [Ceratobasidium sp. 428]|nr:hypothetical protein FRC12_005247 [Ceratobasidium sp. 428]
MSTPAPSLCLSDLSSALAHSEGTQHRGCGHYVLHWVSAIYDCEDPKCNKSSKHPDSCGTHNTCTMEYGPDIQKITAMNYEPCERCKAYFAAGGKAVRRY